MKAIVLTGLEALLYRLDFEWLYAGFSYVDIKEKVKKGWDKQADDTMKGRRLDFQRLWENHILCRDVPTLLWNT